MSIILPQFVPWFVKPPAFRDFRYVCNISMINDNDYSSPPMPNASLISDKHVHILFTFKSF